MISGRNAVCHRAAVCYTDAVCYRDAVCYKDSVCYGDAVSHGDVVWSRDAVCHRDAVWYQDAVCHTSSVSAQVTSLPWINCFNYVYVSVWGLLNNDLLKKIFFSSANNCFSTAPQTSSVLPGSRLLCGRRTKDQEEISKTPLLTRLIVQAKKLELMIYTLPLHRTLWMLRSLGNVFS